MSIFRRRLLHNQSKPYDTELEYLQSDGNQYFTLPFIASEATDAFEITFRLTSSDKQQRFFSPSVSPDASGQLYMNGSGYVGYTRNGAWSAMTSNSYAAIGLAKHTLKLDYKSKKISLDFYVKTISSASGVSNTNLMVTGPYGTNPPFKGLIYSVKVWRNNVLRYDLIPVKKEGVGCFFDNVTKNLFYNEGSGNWTLGYDKYSSISDYTVLDYIENTASAATEAPYIDTMVNSNSGSTQMSMTAKWNTISATQRCGIRISGSTVGPWIGCTSTGKYADASTSEYDTPIPSTTEYTTFTTANYPKPTVSATAIGPIALFRVYHTFNRSQTQEAYCCRCKMKRFVIYVNGNLVRDFLPVLHPDNVYGMFDVVENKFYFSANSVPFTGGFDT